MFLFPGSLHRVLFSFFLSVSAIAFSSRAFAWGDLGHSTVGYIADYKLTKKAKNMVYQILGPEPLAVAAVYPDHVRSDNRYNQFSSYHFLEIKPGKTFADLKLTDRADKDADTLISRAPRMLLDPQISREQKMILLRYIVHLVGDVHQPLHIGNGLDRGGNLCDVQWTHPVYAKLETDTLHSFWDDKIMLFIENDFQNNSGSSKKLWFGYREFGDMLLKENQNHSSVNYEKVINDIPGVWYTESQELHEIAYPNAAINKPKERPYCKTEDATRKVVNGSYDPHQLPIITEAFLKDAIPVVKKRLLTAGYRLAGLLNRLAEEGRFEEQAKEADAKIFDSILITNKKNKNSTAKKNKK